MNKLELISILYLAAVLIGGIATLLLGLALPKNSAKRFPRLAKLADKKILLFWLGLSALLIGTFAANWKDDVEGSLLPKIERDLRNDTLLPRIETSFSVFTLQPSAATRKLTESLPASSDTYILALKAIGQHKYDAAIQLLDSNASSSQVEPARLFRLKALALTFDGRYAEALYWFKKSARVSSDLRCLGELGVSFYQNGDYEASQRIFEALMILKAQAFGRDSLEAANLKLELAKARLSNGEFKSALELTLEVAAVQEQILGPHHLEISRTYELAADILEDMEGYDEALRFSGMALDIMKRSLPPMSPEFAEFYSNYAGLLKNLGRFDEAGEHYNTALAIAAGSLGNDHPATATVIQNMGYLHLETGRDEEAKVQFLKAIELSRSRLGYNHPETGTILMNAGRAFLNLEDFSKAREYITQSQSVLRDSLSDGHPLFAYALVAQAVLESREKNEPRALELYSQALAIFRRVFGDHNLEVASVLSSKGVSLVNTGDLKGGEACLIEALAIRESKLGLRHPSLVKNLASLGTIARMKKDYVRARDLYQTAIEIANTHYGPNSKIATQIEASLARIGR